MAQLSVVLSPEQKVKIREIYNKTVDWMNESKYYFQFIPFKYENFPNEKVDLDKINTKIQYIKQFLNGQYEFVIREAQLTDAIDQITIEYNNQQIFKFKRTIESYIFDLNRNLHNITKYMPVWCHFTRCNYQI